MLAFRVQGIFHKQYWICRVLCWFPLKGTQDVPGHKRLRVSPSTFLDILVVRKFSICGLYWGFPV